MQLYHADFHIHSCLSPCGSLDSSPAAIVRKAVESGLDIIAISDHNSLKHCALAEKLAQGSGLKVVFAAEVTTKEEVHALALFGHLDAAMEFQQFIELHLNQIPNDPDLFGDQPVLDMEEMIVEFYPWLLINSLNADIYETMEVVHRLGGLFIPAHVEKPANSLFSQLGIFPFDLKCDAVEIFKLENQESVYSKLLIPAEMPFITNSDAHYLNDIGKKRTQLLMEHRSWEEICWAIKNINGRKVVFA